MRAAEEVMILQRFFRVQENSEAKIKNKVGTW